MRNSRRALAVASAVPLAQCGAVPAFAQTVDRVSAPVMEPGVVTGRSSQLGHSINATRSEDAL